MTLCSENHDEVCYECRDCPACELLKETESLSRTIEQKDEQIQNLEGDLENANAELKERGES